jgi:ribosome maturation factor RimP
MSDNSTMQRVRALVDPIVADLKLDLYDLEFRGGTLRVTIDTPPGSEGGVNLENIALCTRLISRELDFHDPVPGHYTLEVTSPGLERTLRLPAHYQREVGKTVAIRLRDTGSADRRVLGVLVAADDTQATVRLDRLDADGQFVERVVPYGTVDRAKTVFEWGPTPKPGTPEAKKAAKTAKPKGPAATPASKQKAAAAKSGKTTKTGTTKKTGKGGKTTTTSRERRAESRKSLSSLEQNSRAEAPAQKEEAR